MKTLVGHNNLLITWRPAFGGAELTRVETADREVTLPDTVENLPVTALGPLAFDSSDEDKPQGEQLRMTCGLGGAEMDNKKLTCITLPATLRRVGAYAFYNCSGLREVRLSEKIEHWGNGVFMNCQMLNTIFIRAADDRAESVYYFANEFSRELDITVEYPEGVSARLIFPGYAESYQENISARYFQYEVQGSGYPYHSMFKDRALVLKDYDRLWPTLLATEHDSECALRMAWHRLRFPRELALDAKEAYLEFLRRNARAVIAWLLSQRDMRELAWFLPQSEVDREIFELACEEARKISAADWKEYAYRQNLHGAIISYLDIKKENFYRIETSVDGMEFATARGWEDLSELLLVYEQLGLKLDREVVGQYIQLPRIARGFAGYLELYYKYQKTYHVDEIIEGKWHAITASELKAAPFDEKFSVLGLLLARLSESAGLTREQDALTELLYADLLGFKERLSAGEPAISILEGLAQRRREDMARAAEAGQLDKEKRGRTQRAIECLTRYRERLIAENIADGGALDAVRGWFQEEVDARKSAGETAGRHFDNAFRYLEQTFGDSQELVLFVTEITAGYNTSWYVEHFGCYAYFRHNKELLFDDTRRRIQEDILAAKGE